MDIQTMQPSEELSNITRIKYPAYVSPILGGKQCIYIPTDSSLGLRDLAGIPMFDKRYSKLTKIHEYVLEGQIYQNRFVIHDCIRLEEWDSKKAKIRYDERLKELRVLLNDRLGDYSKYIEIPNHIVDNDSTIKELYALYLKDGLEGINVRYSDGLYQWGKVDPNGPVVQFRKKVVSA